MERGGKKKEWKREGSGWGGREVVSGNIKTNRVVQKQLLFGWTARAITELADKLAIGS